MDSWLKNDLEGFDAILRRTASLASENLPHLQKVPPSQLIRDMDYAALPENGIGAMETLSLFAKNYIHLVAGSAGPRYYGFVTGGSTPAAVAGDWLVSALDQNACGSNDSIAPQIERQTIEYFKQMFGLDADYSGAFVTGATQSNMVGLAQARQWLGEQFGVDCSVEGLGAFPVKVVSATPHSSTLKSLAILGMGRNAVVKIPTLPDREAIDLVALEQFLWENAAPCIVVANAGTVNTVDFDDLAAIGRMKERFRFWLHVDAAFGGFAALSPRYRHLVDGLNFADSITVDAHKWLNVPYDAAMQFTRHRELQLKVFQNSAAYLSDPSTSPDYFHYTPESSRRWRALPAWFSILAYGAAGHREIVERNCEMARLFGHWVSNSDTLRLLAPVRMNIVCFGFRQNATTDDIAAFLRIIRDDGRVFFTPTVYKGIPAIRAAISNWQTGENDIAIATDAVKDALKTFAGKHALPV